jgi:hypothetical protein
VKKPKHEKKIMDDIEELPEELEDDEFVPDDEEPLEYEEYPDLVDDDVTKEIMEDDFNQFKEDRPKDWE